METIFTVFAYCLAGYLKMLIMGCMMQSLIAFPKIKRQVLVSEPEVKQPKDFTENTVLWVNQEFAIM
jgi:hypothetical protein